MSRQCCQFIPQPQIEAFETMTRFSPCVNAMMARSFSSADMEPVTSTASGIAAASAFDSSFKWHHTIAGRLWLFTSSAASAMRSSMLWRLASLRSVSVCASPANNWPGNASGDSMTCS